MIALDTNVLLRTLMDDESAPAQTAAARGLVASETLVRVSAAVFLETLWTLHRTYQYKRADIATAGRFLLKHKRYQVQDQDLFLRAMELYAASNIDLADAVALVDAQEHAVTLKTFDRKLSKLTGAQLLTS